MVLPKNVIRLRLAPVHRATFLLHGQYIYSIDADCLDPEDGKEVLICVAEFLTAKERLDYFAAANAELTNNPRGGVDLKDFRTTPRIKISDLPRRRF